ncbi:hypothetical protein BK133_18955 [Paenibacillus sp. FSL H8-0548]|uniref:hypothetical protein n=1 Tax=Paenibacillus sp. FSL H8-0548 TaxID=1920422 RepID=UPI00096CD6D0|nr:hypothetical protein [Paenibacillus sp. FSL H8-0548]OMF28096.1 hypothetical protein BK133_18955 [Paenibacillus sp. FSL H8-0548]
MEFIRDYRHFIEVGCSACGRKHTLSKGQYNITLQGYEFHSEISCSCGQASSKAYKGNKSWTFKSDNNEMMKRNKATSFKLMLVIGFTIVFIASEMVYMFSTKDAEQDSAAHDVNITGASSYYANQSLIKL